MIDLHPCVNRAKFTHPLGFLNVRCHVALGGSIIPARVGGVCPARPGPRCPAVDDINTPAPFPLAPLRYFSFTLLPPLEFSSFLILIFLLLCLLAFFFPLCVPRRSVAAGPFLVYQKNVPLDVRIAWHALRSFFSSFPLVMYFTSH